ncbi:hypothetical protein [Nocardia yunnanensis]|uniref:hypothetical protein n=1 Tax=Nocardia yunnanensis TaxID=2382165 RepID=UPI0013C42721|nr:hypothetical protein [Nocardia yunnanensis]
MVTVVLAIADTDFPAEFTTRQVAVATGLADSLIRPILQRFLAAGLLSPVTAPSSIRGAKYFDAQLNSPAWRGLIALCRELAGSDRL